MRKEGTETIRFVLGPEYKDILRQVEEDLRIFGRTEIFDIDPVWKCITRSCHVGNPETLGWTAEYLEESKVKIQHIGPDVYILEFPKPQTIKPFPLNYMEILFDKYEFTD